MSIKSTFLTVASAFNENPGNYVFDFLSNGYVWPEMPASLSALVDVKDIFFKAAPTAQSFAYVQGVLCCGGVATINHLAVEVGYERLGIGRALVKYIARELSARYEIHSLLFTESHPRAHDKAFFEALGATGIPRPPMTTLDWKLPAHKLV